MKINALIHEIKVQLRTNSRVWALRIFLVLVFVKSRIKLGFSIIPNN